MTKSTRERMLAGAAQMIATRGLAGTSVRELAEFARVPRGSTYHHFPGGKDQLVDEALGYVSERIRGHLEQARTEGPEAAVGAFLESWRTILVDSAFQSGCPVLAVATVEGPEGETAAHRAAAEAFRSWQALLAEVFEESGVPATRAASLSWTVIALLEGAVVLCRSTRSIEPLDRVEVELRGLLAAALGSD
ncbi:TetR/AcrR family transcriptional regulator [Ornithinicoccus hortensis]|uniref:TetR family transcriptional regulator n=1 Tax=Ornithinicoccus hortensis TaxID=82346 RepID=A0A542YLV2_9MICO|nr:TetR/AcrR family transcriptional regulator [Ornithinicoccus hortensis]TQL49067.1 TetR family transcriptional regulator [Ornithinicoccus hortensis]